MKYVGVVVDHSYTSWEHVDIVLNTYPPSTAVITLPNMGADKKLQKIVKLDHYYCFEPPSWDTMGKKTNDELFLHYLRLHKAKLYLFPHTYNTHTYGKNYSKRFQDLFINAHLLGVKCEVIKDAEDSTDSLRGSSNEDTKRCRVVGPNSSSVPSQEDSVAAKR